MKIAAAFIVATLTYLAAASKDDGCKPGTYACTEDLYGWKVCDVTENYVIGGTCPPKTYCVFYPQSQSPYCVPPDFTFP